MSNIPKSCITATIEDTTGDEINVGVEQDQISLEIFHQCLYSDEPGGALTEKGTAMLTPPRGDTMTDAHSTENDAGTALAYLVSMAQGHDYADERKISAAEDALLLAVDDCDRLGAELRAALGDESALAALSPLQARALAAALLTAADKVEASR